MKIYHVTNYIYIKSYTSIKLDIATFRAAELKGSLRKQSKVQPKLKPEL